MRRTQRLLIICLALLCVLLMPAGAQAAGAAPKIKTQPKAQKVNEGGKATFSVTASNAEKYQWQYLKPGASVWADVTAKSGKTAKYTMTAKAGHDGYQYRCVVSSGSKKVTSKAVRLTVVSKPVISNTKKTYTLYSGSTLSVTVKASGSGTLKYKWAFSKNGGKTWTYLPASQRTLPTFTCKVKRAQDGYKYRCTVSNGAGSASYVFALRVRSCVTSPSADQTVTAYKKDKVTLSVKAKNAKSYQWQYYTTLNKWADIKGATKSTYTFTPGTRVKYRCKVTNAADTNASAAFVLDVKPEIVIAAGKKATLKVDASNDALSYQWQCKKAGTTVWKDLENASEAAYTTAKLILSNHGDQYRCLVSSKAGRVYISTVTLKVGKKIQFKIAEVLYTGTSGDGDSALLTGYIGDPVPSRQNTIKLYSSLYPVSDMIRLVRGKSDKLLYSIWGYNANFERSMAVESMIAGTNYAETLKEQGYLYFRVTVKAKSGAGGVPDKLPSGSAVYVNAKALSLEDTAGPEHENFRQRADQFLELAYTPLAAIRNDYLTIEKGKTYTGVPYSSVPGRYAKGEDAVLTEKNVLGIGTSLETFMTALQDTDSLLYKGVLYNSSGKEYTNGTYYGTVCSGFASYAYDLPGYYSTKVKQPESLLAAAYDGNKAVFTKKLDADTVTLKKLNAKLEIGDLLLMENKHAMVVYGIKKYGGKIAEIEIAHQTHEGTRKFTISPDICVQYIKKGYVLYKNNNVAGITRADEGWKDSTWNAPVMPAKGNKSNWKYGDSQTVQLLADNAGGKYSRLVYEKGGRTESINLADKDQTVTLTGLEPGKYKAYLVKADGTKSKGCEFAVMQAMLRVNSETKTSDGYKYSITVNFGGAEEAWIMAIYKDSGGYYYKTELTKLEPADGGAFWDADTTTVMNRFTVTTDAKAQFRLLLKNEYGWWSSSVH